MIKLNPRDQRILDYLKQNRTGLTVRDCIRKLKTTEMRKIVSTLRDKGFNIWDVWEESDNSFGEHVRYKRYFLLTKKEFREIKKAKNGWKNLLKEIQQTPWKECDTK